MALRLAVVALVIAALAVPPSLLARPSKAAKIAILTTAWSPWHSNTEGFRDGLKELGYVEGQNLTFDIRAVQGDPTRLPVLAAQLGCGTGS